MATKMATKKEISTDSQLKALKPCATDTSYPIKGHTGLEVRVRPNNTKEFRHRYTHPQSKRRPYMTIGKYPTISLVEAKTIYFENLRLLNQNIDPLTVRNQLRQKELISNQNTFKCIADQWLQKEIDSKKYNKLTLGQKQRHISYACEFFGNTPIEEITSPMVLEMCEKVQDTAINTGRRVRGTCENIFAYAIGKGLISVNPALQIANLLKSHQVKHQPAITIPNKFAQLLRDIDAMDNVYEHVQDALILQSMLFQRSGDIVSMQWEDIDFETNTWTFSPIKGNNRGDMVTSLIVPLPTQAVAILQRIYQYTGRQKYVFYNPRRATPYLHSQEMVKALQKNGNNGKGYKDIHVPHGFRAAAITMIQEQLGYPKYLPDMQSGHKIKDNNGSAYNRVEFLAERKLMMQAWADYLEDIRNSL